MSVKVSFCIPAYKGKYIKETIDSLLAQTLQEIEIIVADDRSPDNLGKILSEYKDPRIRYYLNEENLGGRNPMYNYNKAFSFATGEYSVIAGDDDLYHSQYAEKMLKLAESHPEVDIFHCRIGIIDGKGKLTKIGDLWPEYESCADYLYSRGVRRSAQTMPEFFVRTSALKAIGGMVEMPLAWYSDDATWFFLAKEKGIVATPEVLFHWRYSGINISSRFDVTEKKVIAGEKFKEWLRNFIPTIIPTSTEDALTLEYVKNHIFESVDQQTLFDLDDTKFSLWFKIITKVELPRRLKLRSVRNRVRKYLFLG